MAKRGSSALAAGLILASVCRLAGQAAPGPPPVAPPADQIPVQPLHASAPAFGAEAEVELQADPSQPRAAAQAALQAALAEIAEIERLTDAERPESAVAALNAAAGKGPRPVEPRLFAALARARDICLWSENRNGPLGAELARIWDLAPRHGPAETRLGEPPAAGAIARAVEHADCARLTLDPAKSTAALAAGSALDLSGFARGLAADRAIETLRRRGAANALVRVGEVWRAAGGGLDGRGWWVTLPAFEGSDGPPERVRLRDQSLAVAARADHPLHVGDDVFSPYLDQRTGRPPEGIAVLATLAVTDLAIDAQALAVTLTIAGSRQGELLMGTIRPRPSILWLQGNGTGPPLAVDYRWSAVAKR